ncbi:ABC transporter ATP-binding protein [Pelobium manganitolerans]|uniref:ABC transporter ATP-binding protein n=1 Tax=Pelobium manganitolerans TaxID=1842495 RepID=UPI003FA3A947
MIEIENLCFSYGKHKVLTNLNLSLSQGKIFGLLGKNGAGKSSLLYQICGLLFPKQGKLNVNGYKPFERNPNFLQEIYLLPEEFDLPNVAIKSFLKTNAPFYPNFSEELFNNYLAEFNIPINNSLQGMSFGQKKKVMISFALATQTKVLLMDEPTNGLDIPSKKQFRKIIAGALQPHQLMMVSTHQVKDLDNLIDHILVLEDEHIIFDQSVESITQKLAFKQAMQLNEVENLIYSEGALRGHAVVAENIHNEHTRFDMEMFFNALASEKQQMVSLFNDK